MFFAVYRYGAKELPVLLIVANTFSTAMIPVIAADVDKGLAELKRKSTKLMHVFFPLTIVLVIVSPVLYRYVFNESFVYSAVIFNIYLLLAIPRVLFPQTVLTGLQHTRYLLVSSVLEIVINVSLSIYLAGKFGLPGIAAGTFVAYLFDKLFLIAVANWVYGIKPGRYINIVSFLGYSLLTFAAFGLGFYLYSHQFWGF
jgi:O-antigen/teichoic acid export membrane protein